MQWKLLSFVLTVPGPLSGSLVAPAVPFYKYFAFWPHNVFGLSLLCSIHSYFSSYIYQYGFLWWQWFPFSPWFTLFALTVKDHKYTLIPLIIMFSRTWHSISLKSVIALAWADAWEEEEAVKIHVGFDVNGCFGGTYYLHLQGWIIIRAKKQHESWRQIEKRAYQNFGLYRRYEGNGREQFNFHCSPVGQNELPVSIGSHNNRVKQ
jgi:hypothetical protein